MADDKYLQTQQKVYDLLKSEGYTDDELGGSAEALFKDKNNGKLAYDALVGAGYDDLGDYDTFSSHLFAPEQKVDEPKKNNPAFTFQFNDQPNALGKTNTTPAPAPKMVEQPKKETKPIEPIYFDGMFKSEQAASDVKIPERPEGSEQETANYLSEREKERYAAGRLDDNATYLEPSDEMVLENAALGKGYSIDSAIQAGKEYESVINDAKALNEQTEGFNAKWKDLTDKITAANGGPIAVTSKEEADKLQQDYDQFQAEAKNLEELRNTQKERYDAIMATPAGKEYSALEGKVNEVSSMEDSPEKNWEMTQLSAQIARNPIYRASLAAEGKHIPTGSEIAFDLNRGEAAYIEAKMKDATQGEKKELKARLKELNHEVLDNKFYQEDVSARIDEGNAQMAEIEARMKELDREALKHNSATNPTGAQNWLATNVEYNNLRLAYTQLSQQNRRLGHILDQNTSDFWVNFLDVFADPDTYSFGLHSLETSLAAKTAMENPAMAGADQLIAAVAGNNAALSEEGQFVEGKGKYGQIAANSMPFMITIAMTGGFGGVAKAVERGITKGVAKTAGLIGRKTADKVLIKTVGATVGDIAAGFVSANTVGAPKTFNDILGRYYGNLVQGEDGSYHYENGESLGKSFWQGEISNMIEYASERAGDHMQHLLGRGVLRAGINNARKAGRGSVSLATETLAKSMDVTLKDFGLRSVNKIDANWMQKAMSGFINASNRAGVQGLPFEVMEEYVGIMENAILYGDTDKWMDFSKFADPETHADIWGGMLYSIGLTQAGFMTMGGVGSAISGIKKMQAYHALENDLEACDAAAREILGDERWNEVKSVIDGTDNKGMPKQNIFFMKSGMYNDTEKRAILDYIKTTYLYRGFNAGTLAQARERITSNDVLASLNIKAEVASAQDQLSDAYMLGYNSSTEKRSDVEQADIDRSSKRRALDAIEQKEELDAAVARQKERFEAIAGVKDMSSDDVAKLLDDEKTSRQVKDAALDYLMSLSVQQGFNDAEENKQIRIKSQIMAGIEKAVDGKFYYETPFGDSEVQMSWRLNPGTKEPEVVYLLSDTPGADGKVPFVTKTGEKGFISRDELFSRDDSGNVVQGLTTTMSLNEFMDAQYSQWASEREARLAMEDAEKESSRQEEKAQQGEAKKEKDARLNVETQKGYRKQVEAAGDEIVYNGVPGTLHNKTDEGATFVPNDDNGKEIPGLTWEQIAKGLPAAEEKKEPVEEAPAPAPEPKVEINGIPVVNGRKQYYHGEGSSVDAMLEDLYGDEYLTEEEVDEDILAKRERARKTRDEAKAALDAAKPENIVHEEGEDVQDLRERRRKAAEAYESVRGGLESALKDAQAEVDFWEEAGRYAEGNVTRRARNAEREAAIQKFKDEHGGFTQEELQPQTIEEAVAESLGNAVHAISLDDAIKETLSHRKDGRVPNELFRHLGAYGILTKKGGKTIADYANDILGDIQGKLVSESNDEIQGEIRDIIIDFLTNKIKTELQDFIMEERIRQRNEADNAIPAEDAVEEAPQGTEVPEVEEPVVEVPEEPEVPVEEPVVEPVVEEPETPVEEAPKEEAPKEEEPKPAEDETPKNEGEKNGEKTSESPGKSVTSQEKESEGEAGESSTYGSSNKVVTKDRYEELKKKMLGKMKGQLNAGFDPEIFAMGVEMAAYHIEAGARKFVDFAKRMIDDLSDAIRPYLKGIYNGARDLPGMEDYKAEMDPADVVDKIDVNANFNEINNEQSSADIQPGDGAGSETEAGSTDGGNTKQPVEGESTADTGTPQGNSGESGPQVGELDGGNDTVGDTGSDEPGANGAGGNEVGNNGKSNGGGRTRKGSKRNGERGRKDSGSESGVGRNSSVEESEEEKQKKAAEAEQKAYEEEKERIKDETDTKKLKSYFEELKSKFSGLTDVFDTARAKISGQLRAVREKLQELFSKNANKSESLAQEKVPFTPVSDPTGEHAIGSVVPSGSADYMRDAVKRLEKEVGKPVAEFVREELGYSSLDEMFTSESSGKDVGLSAEQVDAVGLAIQQIKTGRIFIVGDMTGVGKGRVGAALIRWGHKNGKKVLFCTEQPNLFTAMYDDINDIGGMVRSDAKASTTAVPFIIGGSAEANITEEDDNGNKKVLVPRANDNEAETLFKSGKTELPIASGGRGHGQIKDKQYDFVMTTYSQIQATEEEEEGDSEKVKKKNARNSKPRQRFKWLKEYAKDAVIIMDESHTAAGESTRGENAMKLVEQAQGVLFMSATFAKTPQAMNLYAIRSSMNDAQITREQLINALNEFGVPMQELLSAALFKTGEYVRRERDFEGVKTHWLQPSEIYSKDEIETCRSLSDKTAGMLNRIIDFQRRYVDPIIDRLNNDVKDANEAAMRRVIVGDSDECYVTEYASTPYSGQVSNVVSMMLFAIKAKKAAEMAIEQIKRGEKPVIAIDNTLGAYIDGIEGDIESADFGMVLKKGLAFAMKYQKTVKHFKVKQDEFGNRTLAIIKGDTKVDKYDSIEQEFGADTFQVVRDLEQLIDDYGKETLSMDLSLSPIDYIKRKIEEAGYHCGEITKRKNALVQNPDGTWRKEPIKHDKKDVIRRFNGGKAKSPLPKEQTYDAVIMNRSGATGNSMHASRRFGDQRPRKMIILQAARDPNNEVQIRGRIDRTGQVRRGEYFYIISPIPAEKKIVMMLRQKLASLDATSVGSEKVASNRVDAEDMDNKYGDEVAKNFLADHEEIHFQMDPSKQMRRNKKGEWIAKDGLLYNLLLSMQRMTCAEQEMILQELEEAYAQKIEYLNQNGINDLSTTTMNLEATTVDKAIMVKGKDNESVSDFAHDTTIERVEVNVLRKPMRSSDIVSKSKELGAYDKHTTENSHGETEEVSYGEYIQQRARDAVEALKEEKKRKLDETEKKLEDDIRARTPKQDGQTDEEYEKMIQSDTKLQELKLKNANTFSRFQSQLQEQLMTLMNSTTYFKPGRAYFVPLNESDNAPNMYGRFIGFKAGKDGRPKSVEAVFATKDSRAMVSIPIVSMNSVIQRIKDDSGGMYDMFGKSEYDYPSEEARIAEYDKWWDKMIPENTSRGIRYIIGGNILQACGSLKQYRGTIVTFTRKDSETGEITVDKGLLLAEDFDPENFLVRTPVSKQDVWDNPGEFTDELTHISVHREGDKLVVKFLRPEGSRKSMSNHDIFKDEHDDFRNLCEGPIEPYRDYLEATIPESNAEAAMDYLYREFGFTQGHLLILPDSTEKPDRIVYTNKPFDEVISELLNKYKAWDEDECQEKIDKLLATYKMDITNEEVKTKIRELVQLRQAYIRKWNCNRDSQDLAWNVIAYEQAIEELEKPQPNETPERAIQRKKQREANLRVMEAYKEELAFRGFGKGHAKHFKQGKVDLDTIIDTFNEFNTDKENARIAEKIFKILKTMNVSVFMNEKLQGEAGGNAAGNYVGYNWRFMNDEFIPDKLKAETILHEITHTLTSYAIRAIEGGMGQIIPNIESVANDAMSVFRAIRGNKAFRHESGGPGTSTYTDYGVLKNAREMMAEAGSNPSFRDDLKQVKLNVQAQPMYGKMIVSFEDVTDRKDFTGSTVTAYDVVMEQLEKLIDGFDRAGYDKYWAGSRYGEVSYKELYRRGDELKSPVDRARVITELSDLAKKLGVKFKEDSSLGAKGAFDPKTGQIRINLDRHADAADVQATLLHEAVAHYGLRKMLGKEFGAKMKEIYDNASPSIKADIDAIAKRDGLSTEVAVEEYLANMAEDGRFSPEDESIWQKVWYYIQQALRKLGLRTRLTDADMRALLYASYRNLQTRGAVAQAMHVMTYAGLRKAAELSHEVGEDNGPEDDGPRGGSKFSKEKQSIKEQAIRDGSFMKAPNGENTKLTEDQWLTVRTKAFKKWFGDWENDPANASKVVDENGEPLVVYHGGNEGIKTFDPLKLGNNTGAVSAGMGFFFSSNENVGRSYIQKAQFVARGELKNYFDVYRNKLNELKERAAAKRAEADRLWKQHNSFSARLKNFIDSIINTNTKTLYRQWQECVEEALKLEDTIRDLQVRDWADPDFQEYQRVLDKINRSSLDEWFDNHERITTPIDGKALYPVFLNIRSPFVSDKNSEQDRMKGWYSNKVAEAKKIGSDGAVLKNVIDPGIEAIGVKYDKAGFGEGYVGKGVKVKEYYLGDDYVVFSPDQIKSVDIDDNSSQDYDRNNIHHLELDDADEGFNDLPEEVREEAIRNQTTELYRQARNGAVASTAADMYNDKVSTVRSAVKEVLVDEYAPVDTLVNALAEESGIPVGDHERVSDHLREAGGKAMFEIRRYDKQFLRPMWDALGAFRAKTGESIKNTETYIGLKSGLERNVVLAKRDAKRDYESAYRAEVDAINADEKEAIAKLDKELKSGKISDVTHQAKVADVQLKAENKRKAAEATYKNHIADVDAEIDSKYKKYRQKDYSAITAWAGTSNVADAEQLASDYVVDMETRAGKAETKELWKRINAATKETLKFQYEHDMLTKQQYNDVSKMMEYYVPMRGFADNTAEDLYNYYVTSQGNDFQATLLSAVGRTTMYETPLGNIGAMHSSAISQGIKNQAKLSLLNVVRNRKDNSLAVVTRAWFVNSGQLDENGRPIFEVAYPQIPANASFSQRQAIIEKFEQDMEAKRLTGDAYNAHREVDLHGGVVAFEKESHKAEHIVKVREGGREYGIIINGNPAAAQAINGVKRGNGAGEKALDILRTWTRFLSQMFTTFSVPFWVSNFQRDFGQGLTNTSIRNNKDYLGQYLLNYRKAFKVFPMIIGEEGLEKAIAAGDPVAQLYKEYIENGGPMGQNRVEDNEHFERQMKRYLEGTKKYGVAKAANNVLDFVSGVGEAVETVTRFAVFMTSRNAGRSLHESISDAKEVSTNFARKGSGRALSQSELDRMTHADGTPLSSTEKGLVKAATIGIEIFRATIPFFNAAVQGLQNKYVNYTNNFTKTLIADSIYLMAGFGMSMLLGGAGGDDDKEKYSHTSDYLRRNNLLLPLGNGVYAKWALPQEYRVCFALGDILASAFKRERPWDDLAADSFGALMQLSPIGAVTDEVVFSHGDTRKAAENLLIGISPGTVDPILEAIFNRDFKGARLYNEGFNENLKKYPGWTKALPTTGKEYVALTKFLNNITGGNDVERGMINLNPAIVEHLVESYFSGPYQIVVRGPEAIGKAIKGEAGVRDIPLINRMLLNTNDNQRDAYYSNMYYYFKERADEAERINTEYKSRTGEGDKKVDAFYNSKDYQYMLIFKEYEREGKDLRKQSKEAERNGDKELKKELDAQLQSLYEEIGKRCMELYNEKDK